MSNFDERVQRAISAAIRDHLQYHLDDCQQGGTVVEQHCHCECNCSASEPVEPTVPKVDDPTWQWVFEVIREVIKKALNDGYQPKWPGKTPKPSWWDQSFGEKGTTELPPTQGTDLPPTVDVPSIPAPTPVPVVPSVPLPAPTYVFPMLWRYNAGGSDVTTMLYALAQGIDRLNSLEEQRHTSTRSGVDRNLAALQECCSHMAECCNEVNHKLDEVLKLLTPSGQTNDVDKEETDITPVDAVTVIPCDDLTESLNQLPFEELISILAHSELYEWNMVTDTFVNGSQASTAVSNTLTQEEVIDILQYVQDGTYLYTEYVSRLANAYREERQLASLDEVVTFSKVVYWPKNPRCGQRTVRTNICTDFLDPQNRVTGSEKHPTGEVKVIQLPPTSTRGDTIATTIGTTKMVPGGGMDVKLFSNTGDGNTEISTDSLTKSKKTFINEGSTEHVRGLGGILPTLRGGDHDLERIGVTTHQYQNSQYDVWANGEQFRLPVLLDVKPGDIIPNDVLRHLGSTYSNGRDGVVVRIDEGTVSRGLRHTNNPQAGGSEGSYPKVNVQGSTVVLEYLNKGGPSSMSPTVKQAVQAAVGKLGAIIGSATTKS